MTGRFNPELLDEIRSANDIVEVVGGYVRLKQAGATFKGLCPFHNERTPSFTVNREKQLFYCFGCGAGGNVFHFIMKIENLGFREAVQHLAGRAGIRIPDVGDPDQAAREAQQERFYAINALAARFFHYILVKTDHGRVAREYLEGRGVFPETIEQFEIGYAPLEWDLLAKAFTKKGFPLEDAEKVGLVAKRRDGGGYYDRFRQRVIFPIKDVQGRNIGFGGRLIAGAEGPKYLNSPETPLFSKGHTLYALNRAREEIRKKGRAIIVEGYLDVVICHQYGFGETVASLGTALTPFQVKLLGRYAPKVYIAYDADAAGEKATLRGLELVPQAGLEVKVVAMPPGEDPDTFLRKFGTIAMEQALEQSRSLVDYKIDTVFTGEDFSNLDGKLQAVKAVLPVLAEIGNEVEREAYLLQVSDKLGVTVHAISAELEKYLRKTSRPAKTPGRAGWSKAPAFATAMEPDVAMPASEEAFERDLIRLMLEDSRFLQQVEEAGGAEGFRHPDCRRVAAALKELAVSGEVGGQMTVADLLDRLPDEETRQMANAIYFSSSQKAGVNPLDYLRRFKDRRLRAWLQEVDNQVAIAEKKNDLALLSRLVVAYKLLRDRQKSDPAS